jgi:hypothetical protein
MRAFLFNLLTLSPQNESPEGLLACGLVWVAVWFVLVADVIGSGRSAVWKGFWLVIVSVPVLGGILYSLRSLLAADWAEAVFWRKQPNSSGKGRTSAKSSR